MPTVSLAAISSCRILVRSPVPQPRSTMRPPGTGWHSVSRSSKGCWRSERNRSYWSGLHPSIGVTVTALMSSPSRDARRPRAAPRAATPRLTWENGSRAAPVAAPGSRRPSRRPDRASEPGGSSSAPASAGAERDLEHGQPLAPERRPGPAQAHDPLELRRAGSVQSRWRSSLLILSARVTSPACGTGSGRPATPWASASTTSALATVDQLVAQRGERDVVVERHGAHGVDGSGVEPLFHLHQADTGLVVAGEDGALDRAPRRASAATARSAGSPSGSARAAGPG